MQPVEPPTQFRSQMKALNTRMNSWITLTTNLDRVKFRFHISHLNLTESQKEQLWVLVSYAHYHLESPLAFFDFLMEVAIEEKTTLKSFATAEALRKWPKNPIPAKFQDNFLVFLYLSIRDGASTFRLLSDIDSL